MADAAVAPVEQHEPVAGPADVAAMEVAVDERVRDPRTRASAAIRASQAVHQPLERADVVGLELRCRAGHDVGGEVRQRLSRQSGRPSREELVLAADPLDLEPDQDAHHREQRRAGAS